MDNKLLYKIKKNHYTKCDKLSTSDLKLNDLLRTLLLTCYKHKFFNNP